MSLSEIDKPYGELLQEQQFALRGALDAGEIIENFAGGEWAACDMPTWDVNCKYRVQPIDKSHVETWVMEVEAFETMPPDFKPKSSSRRKVSGKATVEMKNGKAKRIIWIAEEAE